jgi:hypothetical protein
MHFAVNPQMKCCGGIERLLQMFLRAAAKLYTPLLHTCAFLSWGFVVTDGDFPRSMWICGTLFFATLVFSKCYIAFLHGISWLSYAYIE